MVVAVVNAGDIADSETMPWRGADLNTIAGGERTLRDDPQVASGPISGREHLGEPGVLHTDAQLVAGRPGLAHLEDYVPDPPVLAYHRSPDVDAPSGEIFAEHARGDGAAELGAPPLVVLRGVGVDRLVDPTMDASVGLIVTDEVDALDPYRAFDRKLVDPGRHDATPEFHVPWLADVDRDDPAHRAGNAWKDGVMPEGVRSVALETQHRNRRGRVHVASAIFYFSYPFNSSVKHPVSRMTSTRDQVCVLTGLMSYGSFRTYISPTPSLCKISKDPLIYTPSSWTHGSAATTDSTKLRIQSSRREKARSMSAPARSLYIGRPMLLNAVGGYRGRLNPVAVSPMGGLALVSG